MASLNQIGAPALSSPCFQFALDSAHLTFDCYCQSLSRPESSSRLVQIHTIHDFFSRHFGLSHHSTYLPVWQNRTISCIGSFSFPRMEDLCPASSWLLIIIMLDQPVICFDGGYSVDGACLLTATVRSFPGTSDGGMGWKRSL